MDRFKNVETISLLHTAKLFLQKALKKEVLPGFKALSADEETLKLVKKAFKLAGDTRVTDNEKTVLANTSKCLKSVFNVFDETKDEKSDSGYLLREMTENCMDYPIADHLIAINEADFGSIARKLLKRLNEKTPAKFSPNQLLRLLEVTLSYVPDGIINNQVSDISLFDRAKLSAAFSACMAQYITKHNLKGAGEEDIVNQPVFFMVSGDISGIQQFIYTIPSKGALKSLRGRSFYLEILLENIVDEILSACNVSRSCLLYTGGGHFYLLIPNTEENRIVLETYSKKINSWFLKYFGTLLYIAMGWTPCSVADLTSDRTGDIYRNVGKVVSENKLCRYDEEDLVKLFNPECEFNKNQNGARECSICHMSNVKLEPYNSEGDAEACPVCRNLFMLGEKLVSEETAFIVSKSFSNDSLPIPGITAEYYLKPVPVSKIQKGQASALRIYVKNIIYMSMPDVIYLWVGDYTYCEAGKVLEFSELADLSGGEEDETGIDRLAVLRADVDNLGAAFISGFPERYASLIRTSVLSRYLSLFFKRYVRMICKGRNLNSVPDNLKNRFALFDTVKKEMRKVHIVYSGGDDLFIVGSWDDLIELAVDIRRLFSRFTNNKMSFSAGIGFFQDKCPVAQMARKTGELEAAAKENTGKDSIALFGMDSEVHKNRISEIQRYKWKDFAEKVCGEKLKFLIENIEIDESENKVSSSKLKLGKTALYRLLMLMEFDSGKTGNINVARFAYTLARMDPGEKKVSVETYQTYKKISQVFYEWFKVEEDRKQLSTALQLLIYKLREKGVQSNG